MQNKVILHLLPMKIRGHPRVRYVLSFVVRKRRGMSWRAASLIHCMGCADPLKGKRGLLKVADGIALTLSGFRARHVNIDLVELLT